MGHPRLHGPGAGQHLGHEDEILAELDPDDAHPGDQRVVHDLEGVGAFLQRLCRQRVDGLVVALDQRRRDVLHRRADSRGERDVPLDLVRPFEELLNLGADARVGDVGRLGHVVLDRESR